MALAYWHQRYEGIAVRSFYFFLFAAGGSFGPFLWPYLRSRELTGTQLGIISATGSLLSLVAQPLIGWSADRLGDYRRVLALLALGAALFNTLLGLAQGFLGILVGYALWGVVHCSLVPLIETVNLVHSATSDNYGRVRMWGAIGFVLGASIGAFLMELVPLHCIFAIYPVWMGLLSVASMASGPHLIEKKPRRQGILLRTAVKTPGLLYLMSLVFLVNTAFAGHNIFFSIYLQQLNAGPGMIGAAWAIAGLSEMAVLFTFDRMAARWGTRNLLIFGGLCYAVRYAFYSIIRQPALVLVVQLLQGVTFPLFASAVVLTVNRMVPSAWRATGQSLTAAVGGSMAGIIGNLVSGWIFDIVGVHKMYAALGIIALVGAVGFAWQRTTGAIESRNQRN